MNQETLLNRMTTRIRQSLELQEILSVTVAEIRSFLNTDRIKIYRFQPDGTGQVIAESVAQNRLPSLLNLYFPAGDIPLMRVRCLSKLECVQLLIFPTNS